MKKIYLITKIFQKFLSISLLFILLSPKITWAQEMNTDKKTKFTPLGTEKKLSLSIKDAIVKALENNLDIAIERFNPKIQETDITKEKSAFDPVFSMSIDKAEEITPSTARTIRFGGPPTVDAETNTFKGNITQKFVTGTEASLEVNNFRNADTFNNFASEYETDISLKLAQPLLRNFWVDVNKTDIYIAQNNKAISDDTFREQVIKIISDVQKTYWELVFRIEDLQAKQKSLGLAKEFLERGKIQVEAGTLAPLEIVQGEARVAAREEDVIVAEDAIRDAEDRLKRILNLSSKFDEWDISVVPVDKPSFETIDISLSESVKEALQNRPDYARIKKNLENTKIQMRFAKNQLLPKLDFVAMGGYNALEGNLGNSIDELSSTNNPFWSLGVEIEIPIGNRQARSQYTRRRLEIQQAKMDINNLELQIFEEVRNAVRQIQTDTKRVHATKVARILAQKQLEVEEKKLEVGMSTSFFVLDFQEKLSVALSNEAQAITDYNKSLAELYRILGTTLEKNNIVLEKSKI